MLSIFVEFEVLGYNGYLSLMSTNDPILHQESFDSHLIFGKEQFICQLVHMKVQVHKFLEPPLGYNNNRCLWKIQVSYGSFNQLGSYRNIMQF